MWKRIGRKGNIMRKGIGKVWEARIIRKGLTERVENDMGMERMEGRRREKGRWKGMGRGGKGMRVV